MTLTNEQLIKNLNGETYTLKTDDDTSDILWGQDNGIQFYEMFGVPYDDPKWDKLLDQLTLEEAMYIFSFGGPTIPGAESIGTVETYMTENAGNGVAVNLNASKDPNAPWLPRNRSQRQLASPCSPMLPSALPPSTPL